MSINIKPFYTLSTDSSSLVVDCRGNAPTILYWGVRLSEHTAAEMLAQLSISQEAPASAAEEAPISLSPELGIGFQGNPGIELHRQGQHWGLYTQIQSVNEADNQLFIVSESALLGVRIGHHLGLDPATGVLTASTQLTNIGNSDLCLQHCHAPCIPVPMHFNKILGFKGRWGNEFQPQSIDRFVGAYVRENRSGRTSHDSFPALVVHTEHTNETRGEAYALHLGWSGNHQLRVEEQASGRAYAQLGELFYPGEIILAATESYQSPILYGVTTDQGFNGLSRDFHRYVRTHLTDSRMQGKIKPVHFNTWEAMYFDLSEPRLFDLVDEAAALGIERFVLDDGWFKNRLSDAAGLGDWVVDSNKFTKGLGPLIDRVTAKGMEFGLWVEPEMVNPDSDLYRAHPDWVLGVESAPQVLARQQLVLDLSRPDVQDYLYKALNKLLTEYPISYFKWDMNRAIHQPGNSQGRGAVHRQTQALYQLLARIRHSHPQLQIESCSSGGGRADFAILAHTDRIWTSDNNDALDRLRIQKGFSFFFPAELMGSHVGPRDCHITGRTYSMALRAGVALFGDMGVETNLLQLEDGEKAELKAAIALHKQYRELIFSADLVRLDLNPWEIGFGVLNAEQEQALFFYALLDSEPNAVGGRLRLSGLNKEAQYRLEIVWPLKLDAYASSAIEAINGSVISGEALINLGLQLPIMRPAELLILSLQQV